MSAHQTQEESDSTEDSLVYQRLGEYVVSFQAIENKLREIGWCILDPGRSDFPPKTLRTGTSEQLINNVQRLIANALSKCDLAEDLLADFQAALASNVQALHEIRKDRNDVLHSAFIELKTRTEAFGILRASTKFRYDDAGSFGTELLSDASFVRRMSKMAEVALFLNRAQIQLVHRYRAVGQADASKAAHCSKSNGPRN